MCISVDDILYLHVYIHVFTHASDALLYIYI